MAVGHATQRFHDVLSATVDRPADSQEIGKLEGVIGTGTRKNEDDYKTPHTDQLHMTERLPLLSWAAFGAADPARLHLRARHDEDVPCASVEKKSKLLSR